MPTEIIGEFGTPETEREWIVAECKLAIEHLKKVCGEPPPEMRLVIQWQKRIAALREQGVGWKTIAAQMRVGVGTIHRFASGGSKIREMVF
jgi:hypothetical protein